MKNIYRTLFGQLYFLRKQIHFEPKTNIYCETFFIPEKYLYGIFDYKKISNTELFSNIIIGSKDNLFKIQERYRFINNIENIFLESYIQKPFKLENIDFEDIDNDILNALLSKTDKHIINCSCCHRY